MKKILTAVAALVFASSTVFAQTKAADSWENEAPSATTAPAAPKPAPAPAPSYNLRAPAAEPSAVPTAPVVQPVAPSTEFKNESSDEDSYAFLDLCLGYTSAKMTARFENNPQNVSTGRLGLTPNLSYNYFEFKDLETKGSVPIGVRIGKAMKHFGFDVEVFYQQLATTAQTVDVETDTGSGQATVVEDYIKMKTFGLVFDAFLKGSGKVSPYIGAGLGMTINTIESQYIQYLVANNTWSTGWSETKIGIMPRFMVGLRTKIANKVDWFIEGRYAYNMTKFDRSIQSESDNVSVKMIQFITGLGYRF